MDKLDNFQINVTFSRVFAVSSVPHSNVPGIIYIYFLRLKRLLAGELLMQLLNYFLRNSKIGLLLVSSGED